MTIGGFRDVVFAAAAGWITKTRQIRRRPASQLGVVAQ